jgi:hypothetical protein
VRLGHGGQGCAIAETDLQEHRVVIAEQLVKIDWPAVVVDAEMGPEGIEGPLPTVRRPWRNTKLRIGRSGFSCSDMMRMWSILKGSGFTGGLVDTVITSRFSGGFYTKPAARVMGFAGAGQGRR